mmetsp:Transcript_96657/g.207407  ORF Transcript_96657/g.207407 Transcript_96657/m.207407 type:complete len:423 (-) Transcript_96657:105-1373(-)
MSRRSAALTAVAGAPRAAGRLAGQIGRRCCEELRGLLEGRPQALTLLLGFVAFACLVAALAGRQVLDAVISLVLLVLCQRVAATQAAQHRGSDECEGKARRLGSADPELGAGTAACTGPPGSGDLDPVVDRVSLAALGKEHLRCASALSACPAGTTHVPDERLCNFAAVLAEASGPASACPVPPSQAVLGATPLDLSTLDAVSISTYPHPQAPRPRRGTSPAPTISPPGTPRRSPYTSERERSPSRARARSAEPRSTWGRKMHNDGEPSAAGSSTPTPAAASPTPAASPGVASSSGSSASAQPVFDMQMFMPWRQGSSSTTEATLNRSGLASDAGPVAVKVGDVVASLPPPPRRAPSLLAGLSSGALHVQEQRAKGNEKTTEESSLAATPSEPPPASSGPVAAPREASMEGVEKTASFGLFG